MAQIITIANQKGGVGKTTTATALTSGLSQQGYKALLVDTDPQSNASDSFNISFKPDMPTIYSVFTQQYTAEQAVIATAQGNIIPGDLQMSAADMQFVQQGREYLLKKALSPILNDYDYIIIDSPPALGIITINALTAAHKVVIPMLADRYSLQGLSQLSATIATVQEYSNPTLVIDGILLTKFNSRTVLARDIHETILEIAQNWNTKVYQTTIRQSISLPESQTQQESIFTYAPHSTTAEDYKYFVQEFLRGDSL